MKKNLRVIQINGLRGLFVALGIVICLIAGFVAFPGLVMMKAWNFMTIFFAVPKISMLQGLLLWGITVVSYMLLTKRRALVSFRSSSELSEEEMKAVMQHIQYDATQKMMSEVISQSIKEGKAPTLNMPEVTPVEDVISEIEEDEKQTLEN